MLEVAYTLEEIAAGISASSRLSKVCGSLCYLRQIVFPFCGKLREVGISGKTDIRAAPLRGDKSCFPLALCKAALYQFFNDGGAGGG